MSFISSYFKTLFKGWFPFYKKPKRSFVKILKPLKYFTKNAPKNRFWLYVIFILHLRKFSNCDLSLFFKRKKLRIIHIVSWIVKIDTATEEELKRDLDLISLHFLFFTKFRTLKIFLANPKYLNSSLLARLKYRSEANTIVLTTSSTGNDSQDNVVERKNIKLKYHLKDIKFFSEYLGINLDNSLRLDDSHKFNTTKYIHTNSCLKQLAFLDNEISSFEVFFLRKNRVFNKGRYSRNRQTYRTGVYLCFYLSVISIFGLYYTFYKFSFNFSYLWLLFFMFLGSFIFSKSLKYNLFSLNSIKKSFNKLFLWCLNIRL